MNQQINDIKVNKNKFLFNLNQNRILREDIKEWEIKKEVLLSNKPIKNTNLNMDANKHFSRFYKNKYLNAKGNTIISYYQKYLICSFSNN